MAEETVIWRGSSSQVRNLHVYLLCVLAALVWTGVAMVTWMFFNGSGRPYVVGVMAGLAVLCVLYAVWRFILLRSCEYEITTERLRLRRGLFSKRTEEVELYRVKDHTLIEPFWQRFFGVGTIQLTTHDTTTPLVEIEAIRKAREIADEIRKNVEACREKKRVRLAELE
ncbi:MAG: PH domain-containing protein [Verrucomicrobia bacterium]|nr:PH domain-containing protein [Verrucomicrobiota bacterium]